jgi:hypothetical protein
MQTLLGHEQTETTRDYFQGLNTAQGVQKQQQYSVMDLIGQERRKIHRTRFMDGDKATGKPPRKY